VSDLHLTRPTAAVPVTQPKRPRVRVQPREVLAIAWRSIRANVMRSVLTTIGVVIGVAAVVALTSIGAGVTARITNSIASLGTNLLTVQSGSAGFHPGLVRSAPTQTVTVGDAEAIVALNDVRAAGIAPVAQTSTQVKAGANNLNATVLGTWASYAEVRNSQPETGTFFSTLDVDNRNRVAVIGSDVASELFAGRAAVGATLQIKGVSYEVVGVLPDKGNSFGSSNGSVLIPLSTYLQRVHRDSLLGTSTLSAIYVEATSPDTIDGLQSQLTQLIAGRHGTLSASDYDFRIQNQTDSLESLNSVTQTLTLFLGAIAGISLLVGGIGIMNIMLVSVTERTREIGVRKALGAKPRHILAQFLTESIVLSVGGGVLGVALGLAIALLIVPHFGITAVPSMGSALMAFGFAVTVGVFFGYYPARRAAALDPVASLRYE
jgi:putative ABC transport system permease protein